MAICLMAPLQGYGQSNPKVKKAYDEFNAGHYSSAADMLRSVYNATKIKEEQAEILFKMGECYRLISKPKNAELWYGKAINRGFQNPIVHLHLGEVKKMREKYAEAKEEFQKYKEKVPGDRRGEDGVKSCDLALQWIESGSGYVVDVMKLFNSRQNDFSPAFASDASDDYGTVYFTSSRDAATGKNVSSVAGEKFSDIFVSKKDRKQVWSLPVPIEGEVNTEFDEGMCSFTADFNTMYFTRCRSAANKAFGCQIHSVQLVNGKWAKDKAIEIANDTVVVAHPAIAPDDLTLYFVSDMPGGQGGKDIWKVTRLSSTDNWGRPENLGSAINTSADEMFPYVHPDGTLYFSSNGHIGLGGLDIFKAREENGKWNIENMGYPINSHADDFGITFQAETERGFFTTNRGLKGDDEIYSFALPPLAFTLVGLVKDEKTEQPLSGANVKVISSDGSIAPDLQTGNDGQFRMTLKPGTDYVFQVTKENYLNGRARETTKGLDRSRELKVEITLTSIARPIEIPNIFYDYNSADLRPESLVSLDNLVDILNNNLNITIELGSHTDSRGSDSYNLDLSQRRAQSVVNYLIEKGIARDRLVAKGYGEGTPKVVDEQMAAQHSFLRNGVTLTENYINSLLSKDDQEIAHEYNRRTDFRVLRTDYPQ